jgi:hypothetical protein
MWTLFSSHRKRIKDYYNIKEGKKLILYKVCDVSIILLGISSTRNTRLGGLHFVDYTILIIHRTWMWNTGLGLKPVLHMFHTVLSTLSRVSLYNGLWLICSRNYPYNGGQTFCSLHKFSQLHRSVMRRIEITSASSYCRPAVMTEVFRDSP